MPGKLMRERSDGWHNSADSISVITMATDDADREIRNIMRKEPLIHVNDDEEEEPMRQMNNDDLDGTLENVMSWTLNSSSNLSKLSQ